MKKRENLKGTCHAWIRRSIIVAQRRHLSKHIIGTVHVAAIQEEPMSMLGQAKKDFIVDDVDHTIKARTP